MSNSDYYTRMLDKNTNIFINGYFYIFLSYPKKIKFEKPERTDYIKLLSNSCHSFTPPSLNISKIEIPAYGGVKRYIPTNQEISSSFSLGFTEEQNLPIYELFKKWTDLMFNKHLGCSNSSLYKGFCYVFITKPTRGSSNETDNDSLSISKDDVEEVMFFDGIFPEKYPCDILSSDISTNDKLNIDISFSFDSFFVDKNFDISEFLYDFENNIGVWSPYELDYS